MSTVPPEDPTPAATGDETAAFQRYYLAGESEPRKSLLYRLLVGWWRDRRPR